MNAIRRRPYLAAFVGALALGYGVFLCRSTSHAAGGADSSGYLNLARTILRWEPVQPVRELRLLGLGDEFRQAFIPLGYVRGPRPATMAPCYPPGLPLQVAFAAFVFGWARGPFWVAPISAVACFLLMIALGRDLGLRRWPAIGGAVMLAASPDFVFQALQPMSDVPATCWSLAGVLCARRSRADLRYAALAGFAFGVAALVRPTSILLLPALIVFLGIDFRRLATFGIGGLPALAFFTAYNVTAFGAPFRTGYAEAGLVSAFAWGNFPPRFLHYTHWLSATLTIAVLLGWIACLVNRNLAPRDRAALGSWFVATFIFYCFYGPYDSWIFLRFLLPAMPALILGFFLWSQFAADRMIAISPFPPSRLLAIAALAIVAFEIRQIRNLHVRDVIADQSQYPDGCAWASRQLPANAFLVTMQLSGSVRYYTRFPNLRWNGIEPGTGSLVLGAIARSRRPVYALLFPFEEAEVPKWLPGIWARIGDFRGLSLWRLSS